MIKYKRIAIFVGHSLLSNGSYTSADGRKQGGKLEYDVCKQLAYDIEYWLKQAGQECDVIIVPERKYSSNNEKNYKLPIANNGNYDLIIELHLNASKLHDAYGVEVLYSSSSGKVVATRIQKKAAKTFRDRGVKQRTDLYILNSTKPVAVLLESFFCDYKPDCDKFDAKGSKNFAKDIAEGLIDGDIQEKVTDKFVVGTYQKDVIATSNLNCRQGRGTEHKILKTFTSGSTINIWYIDKDSKGELWGSCNSGVKDSNGNSITGYVHMGYVKGK